MPPSPSSTPPDWHLNQPFWRSTRVFGESLFFIRESADEPPRSRLLFPPVGAISLTTSSRDVVFEPGADYLIDAATGVVTLPPGSRIPFMDRAALYPLVGQERAMAYKAGDEKTALFFGEGHLFHDLEPAATYEHTAPWWGIVPRSQLDGLPRTARTLRGHGTLNIAIIGDSISTGSNASKITKVPPHMPPYTDLWADGLRQRWAATVIVNNFAVSGTGMKYGVAVAGPVMDSNPDLVLIAYGMNDAGFFPVEEYVAQATRVIDTIRSRNAETEIILIASMLGNPEWNFTPTDKFLLFRDALKKFCGPGIVLADLTQMWADLLKVKSYLDLTGNGVNHPNDFGHRIYASFLLDMLGFAGGTD